MPIFSVVVLLAGFFPTCNSMLLQASLAMLLHVAGEHGAVFIAHEHEHDHRHNHQHNASHTFEGQTQRGSASGTNTPDAGTPGADPSHRHSLPSSLFLCMLLPDNSEFEESGFPAVLSVYGLYRWAWVPFPDREAIFKPPRI